MHESIVGASPMNVFAAGAFLGAGGVVLGAFGAHALRDVGAARIAWWTTATQYLFVAAFGMMLSGLVERSPKNGVGPATVLLAAAVLFSGSLYAMGLGAPRWLGAVTPFGGVGLAAGFIWMGIRALIRRSRN
jgi:uncharacterized membrane protein YgdD (TMEM256/DUF423 family)